MTLSVPMHIPNQEKERNERRCAFMKNGEFMKKRIAKYKENQVARKCLLSAFQINALVAFFRTNKTFFINHHVSSLKMADNESVGEFKN